MKAATRTLGALAALLFVPASLAAQDGQGTHRVRAGDTLWDLATRYLADPFLWPEIYGLNPDVVEDPHWIYPGEVLRVPGRGDVPQGIEQGARVEDVADGAMPPAGMGRRQTARPAPQERSGEYPEGSVFRQDRREAGSGALSLVEAEPRPVVSLIDHYSAPLLTDPQSYPLVGVTERVVVENPLGLKLPSAARPYDEVIIRLSAGAPSVGDDLLAVRWDREIAGEGRVLLSQAHLRVTRTYADGDSVRAEVVRINGDYQVGDPVAVPEAFTPRPGVRPEPEEAGPVGKVVGFEVEQVLVGTGEKLFLNLGTVDGVHEGDDFAVFPVSETGPAAALVEDRVATARVVRAGESSSTARVIELRDPGMRPGAPVRRIARMPD